MTGSNVVDGAMAALWVGYLMSAWGIGWAMGMGWRAFLRVLEMAGGG